MRCKYSGNVLDSLPFQGQLTYSSNIVALIMLALQLKRSDLPKLNPSCRLFFNTDILTL